MLHFKVTIGDHCFRYSDTSMAEKVAPCIKNICRIYIDIITGENWSVRSFFRVEGMGYKRWNRYFSPLQVSHAYLVNTRNCAASI